MPTYYSNVAGDFKFISFPDIALGQRLISADIPLFIIRQPDIPEMRIRITVRASGWRAVCKKLHKGIRKITLTYDEIQSAIEGLVKPEDAIKAFKKLIESKMVGSTGDDIRIILK